MEIKNSNVLVTGADGFIGSHLVERLIREGAKVRAFIYYNVWNSYGWLDSCSKEQLDQIEIFSGDVRDPNGVRKALEGMDVVFHLAALIGIPFSYLAPDSYLETNIRGTLNVLQAAKDHGVKRILLASTSEVYGTARYTPIDEKHPKQGQSPYAASKIAADYMGESFYRSFDLPVTIVRPFNTFGPRQSARAIIPTIISQLLAGKTEIHLGSLHPKRDLLFVDDTVSGFIEIAKAEGVIGEEINIASQSEMSVGDLAKQLIEIINPKAKIVLDPSRVRPGKSEVELLLGSNEKLKSLTNWNKQYSFSEGLRKTIQWFQSDGHLQRYKTNVYNV